MAQATTSRIAAGSSSRRIVITSAGANPAWLGRVPFRAALAAAGVPDEVIHFELFDATHMAIDYRYPLSLAWLCQRIAG